MRPLPPEKELVHRFPSRRARTKASNAEGQYCPFSIELRRYTGLRTRKDPIKPVPWIAARVGNRDEFDGLRPDLVHENVREPGHEAAPVPRASRPDGCGKRFRQHGDHGLLDRARNSAPSPERRSSYHSTASSSSSAASGRRTRLRVIDQRAVAGFAPGPLPTRRLAVRPSPPEHRPQPIDVRSRHAKLPANRAREVPRRCRSALKPSASGRPDRVQERLWPARGS